MKKSHFLFVIFLLATLIAAFGQTSKTNDRGLTPARGHYKQLIPFSSTPKSTNEEIDNQKFITDKETIERRMSLKPIYLQNVSVDDFKIPDVPANSSDRTNADNEYLYALQQHRSAEM